eukprot:EC833645.1.p1 GENE.EC833645.1~~EC833645.1.p1  ORF type:complete len:79 (-),score=9.49 EC833645.1:130-366(-)
MAFFRHSVVQNAGGALVVELAGAGDLVDQRAHVAVGAVARGELGVDLGLDGGAVGLGGGLAVNAVQPRCFNLTYIWGP